MAILTCRDYEPDELYISSDLRRWSRTPLQYERMSLTVYQSKFVLVGGRHPSTREPTNLVLTSTTGQRWEPSLPPMPTKRYRTASVSSISPEVLVVAGGVGSKNKILKVVEVLIGNNWTTVDLLPAPNHGMCSTFNDGNFYFIGRVNQNSTIYTCSCASLISSCKTSSSNTSNSQLWGQFLAPDSGTTTVSYSSRLVNVDVSGTFSCYSSTHDSWIEPTSDGERPNLYTSFIAAGVLPTGDIVYAHDGEGVYGVMVSGKYVYMCAHMLILLALSKTLSNLKFELLWYMYKIDYIAKSGLCTHIASELY